jgi:hypothetical protein
MMNWEDMQRNSRGLIEVGLLNWHLPRETKENYELRTSRIQVYIVAATPIRSALH